MSDLDRPVPAPPGASAAASTMQVPVEAIASNVAIESRVAPDIAETSVIDDMYAFAARLRAGSSKR